MSHGYQELAGIILLIGEVSCNCLQLFPQLKK